MQQLMKARPLWPGWTGAAWQRLSVYALVARSAAGRRPDSYESPKAMGETSPLNGRSRVDCCSYRSLSWRCRPERYASDTRAPLFCLGIPRGPPVGFDKDHVFWLQNQQKSRDSCRIAPGPPATSHTRQSELKCRVAGGLFVFRNEASPTEASRLFSTCLRQWTPWHKCWPRHWQIHGQ